MNIKLKLFLCAILISVSSFSVAVDTDHDGLPDDWELANGRNPLVADYQIAAGAQFACALDDTGVVCWGKAYGPSSFCSLEQSLLRRKLKPNVERHWRVSRYHAVYDSLMLCHVTRVVKS